VTIRVLHIIDTWGVGGAETVCVDIAAGIRDHGFESHGAVIKEGWVWDAFRARSVPVTIVGTSSGGFDGRLFFGLWSARRSLGAELVQSHLLSGNLYASVAGWLARVPVVCTFHGHVDIDPSLPRANAKLSVINRCASRIVFVSDSIRRAYLERYPKVADKSVVIHNGVDCEHFKPNRSERSAPALSLLAVGNIRKAKSYHVMLHVAAKLRDAGIPFHLRIAGWALPPLYDELLALRAELGLEPLVTFLGYVSDPAQLFQSADLYLSTSSSEGFSLTTVQAMATGLPVIATRSGGPDEIITDRRDGLLVPVGDVAAIVSAVTRLYSEPATREAYGEAGRLTALNRFSKDRMLVAYEDLYRTLLKGRPSRSRP
jgi:glycosyltransferase involved in cell wall biosynthesis